MSLTLSSRELDQIANAIHLLVSPLDHETVDGWRAAVNRHLGELLSADSCGFLIPVEHGLAMYSEEHDPRALAAFPELEPPPLADGRSAWEEAVRAGVTTIRGAYGSAYDVFVRSAYYNEFAAVNHAHDTISATIALSGVAIHQSASLHFWHSRPQGRAFGDREVGILRLLFPAFRAGVEAQVRWGRTRTDLNGSLDALGNAIEVYDRRGQSLHRTPALTTMLVRDPEQAIIMTEMRMALNTVSTWVDSSEFHRATASACAREVRTTAARYAVRACVYGGPPRGSEMCVLVSVEQLSPVRRPDTELRKSFGFTRAEVRVAVLLSEGKTNAELATELGVSAHTARRHTEHVMQKMGIRSRAQVAAGLFS